MEDWTAAGPDSSPPPENKTPMMSVKDIMEIPLDESFQPNLFLQRQNAIKQLLNTITSPDQAVSQQYVPDFQTLLTYDTSQLDDTILFQGKLDGLDDEPYMQTEPLTFTQRSFAEFIKVITLNTLNSYLLSWDISELDPTVDLATSKSTRELFLHILEKSHASTQPEGNPEISRIFTPKETLESQQEGIYEIFSHIALSSRNNKSLYGNILFEQILNNKQFQEYFLSDLKNQPESWAVNKILNCLDFLAEDTEFYTDPHDSGRLVTNRYLLLEFLSNHHEFTQALKTVLEKKKYDEELKSVISELENPSNTPSDEDGRLKLLAKMVDFPNYETAGDKTMLEHALEELGQPLSGDFATSLRRIAKAYLLDVHLASLPDRIQMNKDRETVGKAVLVGSFLLHALDKYPEAFGDVHDDLVAYLTQRRSPVDKEKAQALEQFEQAVLTSNQGEVPEGVDVTNNEFHRQLMSGAPIFYRMEGAFGDTLLTVASIMDLAKTVQELGTNNTIYFSILDRSNKTFFPLIASLFPPSEFPNVRVIKSAEYDALGQIQETLKTDAYNQQHATPQGIVLSFNGIHSTKIEQNELPSSVRLATFDLPGLKGFLHPPDHPEQATFRRIRQLELSQIFGTTMFNPYDRDDIQPIQDALHQQAQEYLATDPALQETIRELENDPNSTGGFIVILPTGQTEAKQILPDIYGQFNEQFAEYCRTNKIGIIHLTTDVLHQQNTQLLKQKEQPGISYTYMTIQENDDFRKLLAILSMPKIIAGFGSDTGPSHFMALERDFPIAMLFADADPGVFTAKPGILSIEHWVAKKASRGGGVLLPHLTQEFITWIHHHPLTISEEEIAQMHPLVAEWQKEYVKELKSQLGEFLQRVQDSHE